MNFLVFNITLILSGFVALFCFSIALILLLLPLVIFSRYRNPPKTLVIPLMGFAGCYQVYFWGFWSAFCVAFVIKYTQNGNGTWDWIYWILGFIWCISLIGWLSHKERQMSRSNEEIFSVYKGSTIYSLISIVTFLFFSFAPSYSLTPYGYLLKPLRLERYLVTKKADQLEANVESKKSVDSFFAGYEFFMDANILAGGIESSKDPAGDHVKILKLMNKSKERLSECDIAILNKIYEGWGDNVSKRFIPSINYLLRGIKSNGSRSDLARGNALMAESDDWLGNNWDNILLSISKKYGFKIKKI